MTLELSAQRSAARQGFAALNCWAARAVLALILVLGMFGVSGVRSGVSGADRVSKSEGGGGESTEEAGVQLQGKRRPRFDGGPSGRSIAISRAPRTLVPRGTEPPRPTWERPRRSPPAEGGGDDDDDDDDDDELG